MSVLWKISSSDRLVIKNGFLSISAYYSRRSKSKEFESFYKVVSAKPNIRGSSILCVGMLHNIFFLILVLIRVNQCWTFRLDKVDVHFHEGGPNWEIFNPNGNRFYLPNSLGPGWQNSKSTVSLDVHVENLIDFESKVNSYPHKLTWFSTQFYSSILLYYSKTINCTSPANDVQH